MTDPRLPSDAASFPLGVATADGRLMIDSAVLDQAVYTYGPVFDEGGTEIVDLLILSMNDAARRLRLATHIREGVLASTVFVDMHKALEAANSAWNGSQAVSYDIERHSMVGAQPIVVHYEVSTVRVGDVLVQVTVDHTTVAELENVEARFKLMADGAHDGLLLLSFDTETGSYLVAYANPAARRLEPTIRVGEPAPHRLVAATEHGRSVAAGDATTPLVKFVEVDLPTRRASLELTFVDVGHDMVMLTIREITSEARARAALERSDLVLRAIGEGAFGRIVVYEWSADDDGTFSVTPVWWSEPSYAGPIAMLSPEQVMSATDLVELARTMLTTGETRRHGWVSAKAGDGERTIEFTLVQAGDRLVLEFVERTEELEAQTALAMARAGLEAQRSFVSRISHELRSPLNVIHGYSQLMAHLGLPELAASHLSVIERGVERMVDVVDDLLLLGQIDQGLLQVDSQVVSSESLVRSVVSGASRLPWWTVGALEPRYGDDDGLLVRTDPERFVSVALLVAEASSAVQSGIEVSQFGRGARAGLQFVAPAGSPVVETVWRPFLHSHAIPGAGMGLAVARSMAGLLKVSMELREHADGRIALVLLTLVAG